MSGNTFFRVADASRRALARPHLPELSASAKVPVSGRMKGGCDRSRCGAIGSGMTRGMGFAALIGATVIILVVAALVKYVFLPLMCGGPSPKRALTVRSSAPIMQF